MTDPKAPPFKSIRIAGKRHTVRFGVASDDLDCDCGEYLPEALRISIRENLAPDEERETLLHEVMHAVECQQNLRVSEKVIRQLSIGIYEALKNNPELVAYLLGPEEESE